MKHLQAQIKPLSGTYPETYFAGSNTNEGFRSDYSTYIQEEALTQLYLLKGGSGTGKSTLINRCARAASAKGASITLLLCSSDPSSSDGVIISGQNGARVAIVDGTAPHVLDPTIPGAVGRIINLGEFWNSTVLTGYRSDITEHIQKKQEAYKLAQRYLAAYGEIRHAIRTLLSPCILEDKLRSAARRYVAVLPKEKNGTELHRQTNAVSMRGLYRLDTFRNMADSICTVYDVYGSAGYFLDAVRDEAKLTRQSTFIAPPLAMNKGCDEIFFPKAKTVLSSDSATEGRIIHMQRFLDKKALSTCRGRLRFAMRCANAMLDGALDSLTKAHIHHFALEELYKTAMDFSAVDAVSDELSRQILSFL